MSRLVIKYSDVDINAFNVEINLVMNAISQVSFELVSPNWALHDTWKGRLNEEIKAYLDTSLIFIGNINNIQSGLNRIRINALSFVKTLDWTLFEEEQLQFLLTEGKVYGIGPSGLSIRLVSDKGEMPVLWDGSAIVADQFNKDPASPKFITVSDATLGESEITEKKMASLEDWGGDALVGTYDKTFTQDTQYISVQGGGNIADPGTVETYLHFQYSLLSNHINAAFPLVKLKMQLVGYSYITKVIYQNGTYDLNLKVSIKHPTISTYKTIIDTHYSLVFSSGTNAKTQAFAINTDWLVIDLSDYIDTITDEWNEGDLIIEFTLTPPDQEYYPTIVNYVDFIQLDFRYDSAEFEISQAKITDTSIVAGSYVSITQATYDYDTLGVAVGDKVQVSKGADEVFALIFSNSDIAQIINFETLIEKAFSQSYKGGLSAYSLLVQACQRFNYEFWEAYDGGFKTLYCGKIDDIDAATITFDLENDPPTNEPNFSYDSEETYGYVIIRYAGGATTPVQADSPSSDPKTIVIDCPEIVSRSEAMEIALEWANYYAVPRYSISVMWNYLPTNLPIVGQRYNIYLNSSTTLTDQVCRRITIKQDGALGQILIEGFFGNGHTPPIEKLGREIGLILRREKIRSSIDPVAITRQTILSYSGHTPATVNAPLTITDQDIDILLGNGLEIDGSSQLAIDTSAIETIISAELVDGQSIDLAIDALISSHTGNASAHHTRYADSEAIAAVEGEPTLDLDGYVQAKDHTTEVQDYVITEDQKGTMNGVCPLNAYIKVPTANIPAFVWGNYQDTWDASGATYPAGTYEAGDYFVCSVAGTVEGVAYAIGDILIWDGENWDTFSAFQANLFAYKLNSTLASFYKTVVEKLEIRGKHHYEFGTCIPKPPNGYTFVSGDGNPFGWEYTKDTDGTISLEIVDYKYVSSLSMAVAGNCWHYLYYTTGVSKSFTSGEFFQVDFLVDYNIDMEGFAVSVSDSTKTYRIEISFSGLVISIYRYPGPTLLYSDSPMDLGLHLYSLKFVFDGTYWDIYFYIDKVLIQTFSNETYRNYHDMIKIYDVVSTGTSESVENTLYDIGHSLLFDYIPFSLGELAGDGHLIFDDVTITDILESSDEFSDSDEKLMTAAAIRDLVSLVNLSITATSTEINTVCDGASAKNSHVHDDRYYTETEIDATKVAFRARRTTAQTIATDTSTVIVFATEDYDYGSNYSVITGKFTASVAGVYHFDAGILLANVAWDADDVAECFFYKNGSQSVWGERWVCDNGNTRYVSLHAHGDIVLAVNDYVEFRAQHIRGADTNTHTSYNYFNGHRVY